MLFKLMAKINEWMNKWMKKKYGNLYHICFTILVPDNLFINNSIYRGITKHVLSKKE